MNQDQSTAIRIPRTWKRVIEPPPSTYRMVGASPPNLAERNLRGAMRTKHAVRPAVGGDQSWGRWRSMIRSQSTPAGRVPNALPQSPSSRLAQKASATASSP